MNSFIEGKLIKLAAQPRSKMKVRISSHSVYLMTLFRRYATRLSSPPFAVVPLRIPSMSTSVVAPDCYSSLAAAAIADGLFCY